MELKDIRIRKDMTKEEVNKLIYNWIELVDKVYIGNNHPHNWKCKCGNIIKGRMWATVRRSKSSEKCDLCKYNDTEQRYKTEVEKDGEYEYIRSFRYNDILPSGKTTKIPYIQVRHKYCGSIYEVIATGFINQRQRCSRCCGTYENSFAYHIEQELGELLEKYWDFEKNIVNPYHIYKNHNGKVWIKCQNKDINKLNGLMNKDYHGSYEINCSNFIKGIRCGYCNHFASQGKKIHPYDSFGYHHFDKVMSWHPDNDTSPFRVSRLSNKKYKFICETCGHKWNASLSNMTTQNQWCPNCASSKGEKRIKEYLDKNNIKYEKEKIFNGLISDLGNPLRYDFYLPGYNLLIEYDGIQHDKWVEGLMTEEGFKRLQYHDKLKNEYAENNGIKLIRIKAKDFDNIEDILNKEMVTWQINNKKMRENMVKN